MHDWQIIIKRWIVWSLILRSAVWKIPQRELHFIILASLVLYSPSPRSCDSLWCYRVSTSSKVRVHLYPLLSVESNWESEITAQLTIFYLMFLFFFSLSYFFSFPVLNRPTCMKQICLSESRCLLQHSCKESRNKDLSWWMV